MEEEISNIYRLEQALFTMVRLDSSPNSLERISLIIQIKKDFVLNNEDLDDEDVYEMFLHRIECEMPEALPFFVNHDILQRRRC